MSNFKVGQKVVCVNDGNGAKPYIVYGRVYTVRGIVYPIISLTGYGIELEETSAPHPYKGFWSHHFRPAVDRKTDISIFTRMLTPQKEDA